MPPIQWSDGTPEHTLENPGSEDLVVIGVELKEQTTEYGARRNEICRVAVSRETGRRPRQDSNLRHPV